MPIFQLPAPKVGPTATQRARTYNPSDWYWFIGSDLTQVYSSAREIMVPVADADYQVWLAKPGVVITSKIATQAELLDVLDQAVASPRTRAIKTDTRRTDLLNRLRTSTPAQISTWIDNNVTNLAQAREVLKAIVLLIALDRRD